MRGVNYWGGGGVEIKGAACHNAALKVKVCLVRVLVGGSRGGGFVERGGGAPGGVLTLSPAPPPAPRTSSCAPPCRSARPRSSANRRPRGSPGHAHCVFTTPTWPQATPPTHLPDRIRLPRSHAPNAARPRPPQSPQGWRMLGSPPSRPRPLLGHASQQTTPPSKPHLPRATPPFMPRPLRVPQ